MSKRVREGGHSERAAGPAQREATVRKSESECESERDAQPNERKRRGVRSE